MILSRLSAIALSLLLGLSVQAAEFTVIPANEHDSRRFPIEDAEGGLTPVTMIEMAGEIVSGDAKRLRVLLFKMSYDDPRPAIAVSFNSHGGDFREGIAIGEIIFEHRLATLVKRDAQCLSACAVAFMMGYQYHEEAGPFRARYLEAGGKLGFHRPFLDQVQDFDPSVFIGLPQEEINAIMTDEYATFYDLANQLIQEMLAIDPGAWSNDLLVQMLLATQSSGNAFVFLDQVGEAIAWDVQTIGIAPPKKRNRRDHLTEVWWLCYNTNWPGLFNLDWQDADDSEPFREYYAWLTGERQDVYGFEYDVEIFGLTGDGCQVSYDREGDYVQADAHGLGSRTARLKDGIGIANLYKPTTRLANIQTDPNRPRLSDRALKRRLETRKGVCRVFVDGSPIATERCERSYQYQPAEQSHRYELTVPGARTIVLTVTPEGGDLDGAAIAFRAEEGPLSAFNFCIDQVDGNRTLCFSLE